MAAGGGAASDVLLLGLPYSLPGRTGLVAHHREHDVAQLPRHGRDGHAVGFLPRRALVVEARSPGSYCLARLAASHKARRRYGEPCLVMGPPPLSNSPGLAHRRVQPGVAHQGGRAFRKRDTSPISETICARGV